MVEEDDGGYALPPLSEEAIKACSIMPSIIYLLALIKLKIASLCHVKFQCTTSLEEVLRPPSITLDYFCLFRLLPYDAPKNIIDVALLSS